MLDRTVQQTPSAAHDESPPGVHVEQDRELALLLQNVQRGCALSFAKLYVLTSARLFGIVLRINRDRPEAEEILQEVYFKAWQHCHQFDATRGVVVHWLVGIAHNVAISSLRRRGARPIPRHAGGEDDYAGCVSEWPQQCEALAQMQAARAVGEALARLSNEQRHCLTLAFFDGLSHAEIALQVDKPLGTVKSWVRRALAAMRPALAEHAAAGPTRASSR